MSSFIRANGVMMSFVRTKSLSQEPVQLGPDYAAQRYLATWEVTVSRLTLGQVGGAGPEPQVAPIDTSGVRAFAALHDRLMVPRRDLQLRVGGVDLIDIPVNGDVELGPKPLKFVVLGFNGEGSLVGEYTVQYTLSNPCPGRNGKMAFLAHVWKAEDDIDQHFFMTRTYTGVLHMDPRVAGAQGRIHPDAIRALYLPPRTPQLHRVSVQVRTMEDGYTVAYKVTDKQPTAFVNSREVVRMEADHKVSHKTPGAARRALGDVARTRPALEWSMRLADIGVGGLAFLTAKAGEKAITAAVGGLKSGFELMAGLAKIINRQEAAAEYEGIPTVTHTINVTAFGHPESRYASLASAARVVALYRLLNSGITRVNTSTWGDFDGVFEEHDFSDPKAVRVTLEVSARPRTLPGVQPPGVAAPIPSMFLTPDQLPRLLEFIEQVRRLQAAAEAASEQIWAAGGHTMPRLHGNRLVPAAITSPTGSVVAATIRQLVYGGSILNDQVANGFWGWVSSAFAPDLMSPVDATSIGPQDPALTRPDASMTRGVDPSGRVAFFRGGAPAGGRPLQEQLLAAVQELCDYKARATFTQTENLARLP